MNRLYTILGVGLLLGMSGQIGAYIICVANITDQPVKVKFQLVGCKDYTADMPATGSRYSVIEYYTHAGWDKTKLGCILNSIEVTSSSNRTVTASPLKKARDAMFLIELDKDGESLKVTPFAYDQQALDKQILRAWKNVNKVEQLNN